MFFRDRIYNSGIYDWSLRGSVPDRVRGAPRDPWMGSVQGGQEVLKGNHILFGHPRHLGDLPWKSARLNDHERRLLHRFDFLADLKALGTDRAREKGCELIARWVNEFGRWHVIAWEPAITGQRLCNWLRAYDFLKSPDHPGFDLTFLESTAAQMRHLSRTVTDVENNVSAIESAEGLVLGSLCLVGMEALLDTGLAAMEIAVAKQVLADGGHFQRNPAIQRSVLTKLIRVRDTMAAAQVETPHWLQHAIDRMAPMLHALRLGDGKLALFNGSTEGEAAEITAILKAAGGTAKGQWSAPHTGFQRIEAGKSIIVADSGAAVLSGADRDAHAGLLSFEFSYKKNRIIVNCGAHSDRNDDWHEALRATAAHSTLTIDDTNAIEVLAGGGLGSGHPHVSYRRSEAEGSAFLQLQHDGYVQSCGMVHSRDIYLAARGDDLRGRDSLALSPTYMGPPATSFCVRFHLHPTVSAEITGGGDSVLLKLSNREAWRMRMNGGTLAVEDSIYMGVAGEKRRARQIAIVGPCPPTGVEVKWSFIREN